MKIVLAQLNFTVGDFAGNSNKIIKVLDEYANSKKTLVVFPELCVCGYPAEDLVLRPEFIHKSLIYADKIIEHTNKLECTAVISSPWKEGGKIYNSTMLVKKGKIIHKQYKHDLPNYGVFDEKRVFSSGKAPQIFEYEGHKIGMLICEDTWHKTLSKKLKGCDFVLSVNASPYEREKYKKRLEIVTRAVKNTSAPVFYVNQVCGHDDLVFDGGSMVMNADGKVVHQLSYFDEDITEFDFSKVKKVKPTKVKKVDENEHMYRAMMLGLKDYCEKNGFPGVVIGLSGGIDSAITAVIAADALGKENVRLVMMPSEYTSDDSLRDAAELAENLNIKLENIDIIPLVDAYTEALKPTFEGTTTGLAEENIQSRIRGNLLMAISNKFGHMVLTTGNKSEISVGYATLYGDMAGGYNVLKDIYKSRVFELSEWRNKNHPENGLGPKGKLIPENTITRAPTAELRPNQKDEDSLPKYEILDKILQLMVESGMSAEDIADKGYDMFLVLEVEKMLYRAEYKRRQSAPGVKLSSKPFQRDWRYPITNKFLEY
jgi:NAD+ synthase